MSPQLRIAILFSGGGTTLQNLIDATRDGRLPGVEIVKAVSSRADAYGIERCRAAGVPCVVVPAKSYAGPAEHTKAVFGHLDPTDIDLVCLAGWMNRLVLEEPWLSNRVLNIHPSLLPAFGGPGMYGRRVHEAVLASGAKVTGCTVHFVTNELDEGPIVVQQPVPVEPGDTADTLTARVQAAERELYVKAIQTLLEGVGFAAPA
jgi:phosphoribosylglycinamide formyltransferase-1